MRTWRRTPLPTVCGYCAAILSTGVPILEIRLPMGGPPKVRCAACASEPVPANLPPVVATSAVPEPMTGQTMTRFTPRALPFDVRMAQAGEREVGEEG